MLKESTPYLDVLQRVEQIDLVDFNAKQMKHYASLLRSIKAAPKSHPISAEADSDHYREAVEGDVEVIFIVDDHCTKAIVVHARVRKVFNLN